MGKKRKVLIIIGIFLLVLAVIFIAVFLIFSIGNTETACVFDSDCTSVPVKCCSCSNGGTAKAVSKIFSSMRSGTDCFYVMCPAVISNDSSCRAIPKCQNFKCVLVNNEN